MAEDISKTTRNQSKNLDKDYTSQMMERLRKLAQHGKVVTDEDFNSRIDMLVETAISEGICPGPETLCLVLGMNSQEISKAPIQWQARLIEIRNFYCSVWEQIWYDSKITGQTYSSIKAEWDKTINFNRANQPQYSQEYILAIAAQSDQTEIMLPDF